MTVATTPLEDMTLVVTEEIRIDASVEDSFAALLEQMGPHNEGPDGMAMPMTLEARPGGRWFRDLGGDDGHHWGHVQAIKGRRCWKSMVPCSCPTPSHQICSIDLRRPMAERC